MGMNKRNAINQLLVLFFTTLLLVGCSENPKIIENSNTSKQDLATEFSITEKPKHDFPDIPQDTVLCNGMYSKEGLYDYNPNFTFLQKNNLPINEFLNDLYYKPLAVCSFENLTTSVTIHSNQVQISQENWTKLIEKFENAKAEKLQIDDDSSTIYFHFHNGLGTLFSHQEGKLTIASSSLFFSSVDAMDFMSKVLIRT
jgi:PBP1b-binding outer membrane lipoprotein LpoB